MGPGLCVDLVCELKKIVGSSVFSAQLIGVVSHYGEIGCSIGVLQRAACLVVGTVNVGSFAFLFGYAPVGGTSDSVVVLSSRLFY